MMSRYMQPVVATAVMQLHKNDNLSTWVTHINNVFFIGTKSHLALDISCFTSRCIKCIPVFNSKVEYESTIMPNFSREFLVIINMIDKRMFNSVNILSHSKEQQISFV